MTLIHNPPVFLYEELGDTPNKKIILEKLHAYVTEKYPHLASVTPKYYYEFMHIMVVYQTKPLEAYELGDMKQVFFIHSPRNTQEYIFHLLAEFDVDLREPDKDIYGAIGSLFNTWVDM